MDRASSSLTDSRVLLERAGRGDSAAVEGLIAMHLPGLRAFVRLRCGPTLRAKESASDIVQSVCRDVLQHMDRYVHPGEARFRAWLYTTALRKIADRADYWAAKKRDAGREEPQAGSEADAGRMADCYRSVCSPSQVAMARETLERIERAFDALPDHYREAVVLSRIVGLSRAEIAEQMGRTEASVHQVLLRALAQLSETLAASG